MAGHISNVVEQAGFKVQTNDIAKGGEDFLTMNIGEDIGAIVTNPPYSLKRQTLAKLYFSGLPFAVLLPTNTIQTKGLFSLLQNWGCTIIIMVPPPLFLVEGKKRKVVDCCWFLGNFPNNKQGVLETIYHNLNPEAIPPAPRKVSDVMSTQMSQSMDWNEMEDDGDDTSLKSVKPEETVIGISIDEVSHESSGLFCDKCAQAVDSEDGFAGICQGELCNDQHLCRNCAYSPDGTLSDLFCRGCLENDHEGDDFTPPATYAEVVAEAEAAKKVELAEVSDV